MRVIILTVLQGLLEMTGTAGLALVLARAPFSWKRAILLGAGLFVIVHVIRYLPVFFGLHTLAGLLALTVYLVRSEQTAVVNGFMAAFLSLFVLGLLEFASNQIILSMLHLTPEEAMANPEQWALIGLPQAVIMIVLAWGGSRVLKPQRRRENELPRIE